MERSWHPTVVVISSSTPTTASATAGPLACEPNISAAGVVRRMRVGWIGAALVVVFIALAMFTNIAWYWRALAFLPAVVSASGFLQARRRTCIARAREGTFEHEDFSKTPAHAEQVAASRKVANGIRRDVTLIGVAVSALAIATSFVP